MANTQIEAMRLALEALEDATKHIFLGDKNGVEANIRAHKQCASLRQAIREQAMYEVQRLGQEIEQEPVAKVVLTETLELPCLQWLDLNRQFDFKGGEYLYTHPPQRKPLTDEQIEDLYFDGFSISKLKDFARAIEAAHGIKE